MALSIELLAGNNTVQLLAALGGTKQVAQEFNLTTQAVSNWVTRGIPYSRIPDILVLIARAERESGQPIAWRPHGWDRRVKLLFEPLDEPLAA